MKNVKRFLALISMLSFIFFFFVPLSYAQDATRVDPKADKILRDMSNYLKAQKQLTIKAETSYESIMDSGEKLTFFNQVEISIKRPNKLYSHRIGMIRNQEIFYNGKTLTLFSLNNRLYAVASVPSNLDEMLEFATEKLNLVAPGSDLLYSDVYEGLMSDVISGSYIGQNIVNGRLCHHLAYRGGEVDWQIWIQAQGDPIPRKYVITSKWLTGAPEYTLTINYWDSSSKIPDEKFQFDPPKDAKRINFLTPEQIKALTKKAKKAVKEN